jgi:hypothetical protein
MKQAREDTGDSGANIPQTRPDSHAPHLHSRIHVHDAVNMFAFA